VSSVGREASDVKAARTFLYEKEIENILGIHSTN
jgi:hypothetical protein